MYKLLFDSVCMIQTNKLLFTSLQHFVVRPSAEVECESRARAPRKVPKIQICVYSRLCHCKIKTPILINDIINRCAYSLLRPPIQTNADIAATIWRDHRIVDRYQRPQERRNGQGACVNGYCCGDGPRS